MSNDLKVSIRILDTNSALLAKADVTGQIFTINGFSVMRGKENIFVAEPAIKQGSGWLKVIEIHNKKTATAIREAILSAYEKAVEQAASNNNSHELGI
jgi:DNA-binding cell septation regulator SpoVG